MRDILWRNLFKDFGEDSHVYGRIIVYGPEHVSFGKHSALNEGCLLNARGVIEIGDYVHISAYCVINTGGLDYQKTLDNRTHFVRQVVIEDGAWLGTGVIVNPGVRIGKNAVVGAGAVVTQDIPDNMVAVGVPAKPIKRINN